MVLAEPQFFTSAQVRTVEALTSRIIPGDETDPGAREACAVRYIDRALAGAYAADADIYQRGLWELDQRARERFQAPFAALDAGHQDDLLAEITQAPPTHVHFPPDDPDPHPSVVLYAFFARVRRHTIEGTFCDPMYGGNEETRGWRMVGFPGAQWGYSAEEMRLGFDATTIPIKTLADLRAEHDPEEDSP